MSVKVGINGFGRIGRNVVRAALHDSNFEFVAVNDLTDTKTLAHLTKYDSVMGHLSEQVRIEGDAIVIGDRKIKVFAVKDPAELDWSSLGVQVVVESTGRFTDATAAAKHLRGTVKKVIISAPATNEDITIVLGVNDAAYDPAKHHVISNDDDDSQLHERPERARFSAQGFAPCARRCVEHDSHQHRRREGHRPGDAGT